MTEAQSHVDHFLDSDPGCVAYSDNGTLAASRDDIDGDVVLLKHLKNSKVRDTERRAAAQRYAPTCSPGILRASR